MTSSTPPKSSESNSRKPAAWAFWTGWVLTVLPSLLLLMSGFMKVTKHDKVMEELVKKAGFPESSIVPIGIAEIACVVLFLIPQTAVLGAILIAAYLGGAVAVHVHGGEGVIIQIAVACIAWLGLLLREPRLQSLLPLRRL